MNGIKSTEFDDPYIRSTYGQSVSQFCWHIYYQSGYLLQNQMILTNVCKCWLAMTHCAFILPWVLACSTIEKTMMLLDGTVPSNNSSLDGTVPSTNSLLDGTVLSTNSLLDGTLKKLKFQKVSPTHPKPHLVQPQKGQRFCPEVDSCL